MVLTFKRPYVFVSRSCSDITHELCFNSLYVLKHYQTIHIAFCVFFFFICNFSSTVYKIRNEDLLLNRHIDILIPSCD